MNEFNKNYGLIQRQVIINDKIIDNKQIKWEGKFDKKTKNNKRKTLNFAMSK